MGFEIDENVLLKVSGVGAIAYCAFAAAAPREFHNTFMTSVCEFAGAGSRRARSGVSIIRSRVHSGRELASTPGATAME